MSASFTLSPTSGPVGSSLTITATGTSTSWLSGTTFSVSGGTGASVASPAVNTGAQTATFILTVGSASGSLTISDSTDAATATFTADPAFSISPKSGAAGVPLTVTATGASTSWTSETTFSVAGGVSPAITSTSVNSGAQTATFALAPGSAIASLTITDATDSATVAFAVTTPKRRRRGVPLKKRLDFPIVVKPRGTNT